VETPKPVTQPSGDIATFSERVNFAGDEEVAPFLIQQMFIWRERGVTKSNAD
jgi:hypothetical protein